jgi:hypothetical protein
MFFATMTAVGGDISLIDHVVDAWQIRLGRVTARRTSLIDLTNTCVPNYDIPCDVTEVSDFN